MLSYSCSAFQDSLTNRKSFLTLYMSLLSLLISLQKLKEKKVYYIFGCVFFFFFWCLQVLTKCLIIWHLSFDLHVSCFISDACNLIFSVIHYLCLVFLYTKGRDFLTSTVTNIKKGNFPSKEESWERQTLSWFQGTKRVRIQQSRRSSLSWENTQELMRRWTANMLK